VVQDAYGIDPALGQLVEAYIKDESLFEVVEAHLAQAGKRQPHQQALWDLIYHALNHFDIDAGIRASDAKYSDLAVSRLRAVASALMSGSVGDVHLAALRYLGARLPGS
jgi:hypothetical protein